MVYVIDDGSPIFKTFRPLIHASEFHIKENQLCLNTIVQMITYLGQTIETIEIMVAVHRTSISRYEAEILHTIRPD